MATALAVLAALALGWAWAAAARDHQLAHAMERDEVQRAATDGLVALHTIDHAEITEHLDRWQEVTDGELQEDLRDDRESQRDRAEATETVAIAEPRRVVVTDLDRREGTARVIAVLAVEVSVGGDDPATQTRRVNAELSDTGEGWRLIRVEAVS
ncbi:hypothetical protein [Haloechinothrix sp. LS1_15]|uniref:hypothetical protein n=1 Tax=Haloechinothrix sp. LS1_15 TaxID=2652248 RepID=UPI0029460991|nr:hypothetical protein [Haloechinothrix sp. LS1_15]MDV6014126.1 hypothetical protein [Haloechinothrix sp. LS1_15]